METLDEYLKGVLDTKKPRVNENLGGYMGATPIEMDKQISERRRKYKGKETKVEPLKDWGIPPGQR